MGTDHHACCICKYVFNAGGTHAVCESCSRWFCGDCCENEMKEVCTRCKCECIHKAQDDAPIHKKADCLCPCIGSVNFHAKSPHHSNHSNMQDYLNCQQKDSCFKCNCNCKDNVHTECKCSCKGYILLHNTVCSCECRCLDCDCRCNCRKHQVQSLERNACSFCRLKRVDTEQLLDYFLNKSDMDRKDAEQECLSKLMRKQYNKRKFRTIYSDSESGNDSDSESGSDSGKKVQSESVLNHSISKKKARTLEQKN